MHRSREGLVFDVQTLQVRDFYRRFGLQSPLLNKEPDDHVALVVESLGPVVPPEASDGDRPRYGLVGMHERMAAVGGEIDAGPTPTGWVVRCRAPLAPEGRR